MPIFTFLDGDVPIKLTGLQWMSLSEVGHVVSQVSTDDQGGGVTQVWTAGTAVPCRLDPIARLGRDVVGGRIDERSTHVVTLALGTATVTTNHRFAIDNRGTFEVTAVRQRTREWARELEIVAV
jgi:hypothetical protein